MKKIKKIFYPIKTIVLPILLIVVVSIYLSSIFKFIDYEGNGFLIKLSEITFNHPRRVACILLFFGFLCESVADGEHGISSHGVCPCLGAPLCIDAVS